MVLPLLCLTNAVHYTKNSKNNIVEPNQTRAIWLCRDIITIKY